MLHTRPFQRICLRALKIYTKTGDQGTSVLLTKGRLSKNAPVFHLLGNIDELSANIGLSIEHASHNEKLQDISESLHKTVCSLQELNSHIAAYASDNDVSSLLEDRVKFESNCVEDLEKLIDQYDQELPKLRNFILPSGGLTACQLHLSRSICRRAERSFVPVLEEYSAKLSPSSYIYINRLSDYLFMAARLACAREGRTELIFKSS